MSYPGEIGTLIVLIDDRLSPPDIPTPSLCDYFEILSFALEALTIYYLPANRKP